MCLKLYLEFIFMNDGAKIKNASLIAQTGRKLVPVKGPLLSRHHFSKSNSLARTRHSVRLWTLSLLKMLLTCLLTVPTARKSPSAICWLDLPAAMSRKISNSRPLNGSMSG
jgi:hypothetical protein